MLLVMKNCYYRISMTEEEEIAVAEGLQLNQLRAFFTNTIIIFEEEEVDE